VSQETRLEARLGRLEIPPGIFAGTAEIADGFVLDLGDIDRRESARAPQAGQWDGVTTVGFDPIAGLFVDQRGSHDPADVALLGEMTVEPIPPRPRFIDQDQMCAFGLHVPDQLVDIVLAHAEGAEGDDLGVVFFSYGGDSDGLLMDIHSDVERT
jgi:hypothetical protein